LGAAARHFYKMAITIHNDHEIEALTRAGAVAAATLREIGQRIRPGITTAQIDRWVREDTERRGATPSQLGYHGFPAAVCTSVNEVVCHGVPSEKVLLQAGDIVNVDVTSCFHGFHGDTSRTFVLGEVSAQAKRVTQAAQACLAAGIRAVVPGARLGDIAAAVMKVAARFDCGLVEAYGGHGIGRSMHMPPHVPHVGRAGCGVRLRPGMALTIEPMLTIGRPKLVTLDDGWTVVTADGTPSAQFEHTIIVTQTGAKVLTLGETERVAKDINEQHRSR